MGAGLGVVDGDGCCLEAACRRCLALEGSKRACRPSHATSHEPLPLSTSKQHESHGSAFFTVVQIYIVLKLIIFQDIIAIIYRIILGQDLALVLAGVGVSSRYPATDAVIAKRLLVQPSVFWLARFLVVFTPKAARHNSIC